MNDLPALVLASASPYRAELLRRLRLPFETRAAGVDETPQPGEDARSLAERLAAAKARAVHAHCPAAVVIGSDQVASRDGVILGKPGTRAAAADQLAASSGRRLEFFTSLCVVAPGGHEATATLTTQVHFRTLAAAEIDAYLRADEPWDCAGAFRAESLGISLFERLISEDPTALIGLPLIPLSRMLRTLGYPVPG